VAKLSDGLSCGPRSHCDGWPTMFGGWNLLVEGARVRLAGSRVYGRDGNEPLPIGTAGTVVSVRYDHDRVEVEVWWDCGDDYTILALYEDDPWDLLATLTLIEEDCHGPSR
jgi:hypothetical protein